jgi:hypothetical protein
MLMLVALSSACGGADAPREQSSSGMSAPVSSGGSAAPPLTEAQRNDPNALPPGHPPLDGAAGSATPGGESGGIIAPPSGSGTGETGMAWTTPSGWVSVPPTSSMRRAQYLVKGAGGDAECIVFYFGPGQGGSAESNAERWASQFTQADGSPAVAKTSDLAVSGFKVMMVEVLGSYGGGMGMSGAQSAPIERGMLLGAIAEGPDANWFFKFTGPEGTVDGHRAAFEAMIKSLRHGA